MSISFKLGWTPYQWRCRGGSGGSADPSVAQVSGAAMEEVVRVAPMTAQVEQLTAPVDPAVA